MFLRYDDCVYVQLRQDGFDFEWDLLKPLRPEFIILNPSLLFDINH